MATYVKALITEDEDEDDDIAFHREYVSSLDEIMFWKDKAIGSAVSFRINSIYAIPYIFSYFHVLTDGKYNSHTQHFQIALYSRKKRYEYTHYTTENEFISSIACNASTGIYRITIVPIAEMDDTEINARFSRIT